MQKSTKNILAVIIGIALGITIYLLFFYHPQKTEPRDPNWEGLLLMGLAPNSPSRDILPGDEVLGKIRTEKGDLLLVRSRHLETKDYGGTFVVRV